jgi:hypothetical protein
MSHPEQLCVNPRFIKEYLLTFFEICPKLSKKELYLAAWGSEFEDNKEEKNLFGGIKFRPLFVEDEKIIQEIEMQLPPYDAWADNCARWHHACWKSYVPREDTPQKGRNAPPVKGKQLDFSGSQTWHAGSQPK